MAEPRIDASLPLDAVDERRPVVDEQVFQRPRGKNGCLLLRQRAGRQGLNRLPCHFRRVANLVPPFEANGGRHGVSAALEFAVTQLKVPEIVVMGHERCGGIQAALTGCFHGAAAGEGGFVHRWMSQIEEPANQIAQSRGTGPEAARELEEVAIRQSLANLRSFPFVKEREDAGEVVLLGCHFSISEGQLYLLDEAEDSFRPVATD